MPETMLTDDLEQLHLAMGLPAVTMHTPEHYTLQLYANILGGSMSSRLFQEVREKRGLAYSVQSYLSANDAGSALMAQVATKNEKVAESISVIRAEMAKLAENGVSEEVLNNAKSYLTGSYPLRFDTNAKIASQLLGIQQEDLGIEYVNERNAKIKAVTAADIKRLGERLLKVDQLMITVVGQPLNIETGG